MHVDDLGCGEGEVFEGARASVVRQSDGVEVGGPVSVKEPGLLLLGYASVEVDNNNDNNDDDERTSLWYRNADADVVSTVLAEHGVPAVDHGLS